MDELSEAAWSAAWVEWQGFGGHGDVGGLSEADWRKVWADWQDFGGHGETVTPGAVPDGEAARVEDGETADADSPAEDAAGLPVAAEDDDPEIGTAEADETPEVETTAEVDETAEAEATAEAETTTEAEATTEALSGPTADDLAGNDQAEAGTPATVDAATPAVEETVAAEGGGGGDAAEDVPRQAVEAGDAETGSDTPSRKAPPASVGEPVRQRRDQHAPKDRRRADPEQILASYPWTFDPRTLRETVDETDRLGDLADRLTDRLEFAERDNVRAGLLSLRAVVSRVLGELDDALADGREGLRHAEASGELRTVSIAQARLAHVLHWRGEFDEADELYAKAESVELPSSTRAEIVELAGRSLFDQGRFLEAVNHFERALNIRHGDDPERVERIELALDEITRRTEDGWGPYPRARDEAPVRLLDDGTGLWGYAAAVEPRFAEAQPFAEGVAWVRRPDSPSWELIDAGGELVITSAHGYLSAGPFADGLAWVRRDDTGWFAIDRENQLIVPPAAFEDARPFRRGLAIVRQGGVWGAVDRQGRIVVPPAFPRFLTSLHVGGPVDGFTDEGLAVVDAGERFGVLDRTGQLVVPTVHAAVVIHPTAFLVRDAAGLWGALDRKGEPLVDIGHRDRDSVVEALPDEPRPVL
ncbi:WG repeat-containing protein [Actinoplanes sp. G11-F43]|uniref:WG repeat-containing protein n=1 Tax=Actinoplanes sp. G11-F43 TaxID=3424130 RepID=UPI003D342770